MNSSDRVKDGRSAERLAAPDAHDRAPTSREGARPGSFTSIWRTLIDALRKEAGPGQAMLWLPVSMALGAATWFVLPERPAILPVAVALGCCMIVLAVSDREWLRKSGLLVAGFVLAMLAADFETRQLNTTLLDGEVTTNIVGTVVARDVDHAGRLRYTIKVDRSFDPQLRRPPETVRLVARANHEPVEIGGGVSGLVRLRPPSGPALPGSFDFTYNSFFNGIGANGFFLGKPDTTYVPDASGRGWFEEGGLTLQRLRQKISERVKEVLPGEAGGFAAALTVADRRSMSPDTVDALRQSGLAHVLAISGLHMALVAGTFFLLVRACFSVFPTIVQAVPTKKYAAVGALAIATLYLSISGASVSTQRAWIMLVIMLIAVLADRQALTMRNVAIAAMIIIVITPSAVLGPGFQMSFAATAALIATYALWNKPRPGTGRAEAGWLGTPARVLFVFFLGLAVTSLVAGLATAPFAIHHFHRIAAYGLLANLAAMPIVTFIVMPAGMFAVLLMPLGLEKWPLIVMGGGLDAVIAIARYVRDIGGAVVVGQISPWITLVAVAGLLIFVLSRTRLRIVGLALLLLAGAAMTIPRTWPDILIAEDGRLVALVNKGGLATNRKRPPRFIFEQWQTGLKRTRHDTPLDIAGGINDLGSALEASAARTDHMQCAAKTFCVGVSGSGTKLALVEDLSYLGAACDEADIVVTAASIAMERCYSGALLITGRMLRQSGALAIWTKTNGNQPKIRSAVASVDRAWTRHRAYNWRNDSFYKITPSWRQ
ncbi:ComEC/Rec2 family competence protein [Hoeflea prorocentri]|uniref:ComEC/Rec2 family competence protein n=1 Tax=Hoeflea prorocentri TaxID=1922333 RepID=A0A9X3ZHA0_9HYPH|nr:ComEC/Rec2 family competence protein [Hoeflea prorocentri]MCY6380686.1 ComEC/Rec2 family competence protein [Hoeflea prorocentri]MDA5398486.1 ComEC/Rec2 family competence protein [Hoeflea prorocentri]